MCTGMCAHTRVCVQVGMYASECTHVNVHVVWSAGPWGLPPHPVGSRTHRFHVQSR